MFDSQYKFVILSGSEESSSENLLLEDPSEEPQDDESIKGGKIFIVP